MPNIQKITVNGVEYPNPDAMPKEVRALYDQALAALSDTDGDGVPDMLQHPVSLGLRTNETFLVDGKEYRRREDLPKHLRQALDNDEGKSGKAVPRSLVFALAVAAILLAGLWLSGVTPADLLRRFR